MRDQLFNNRPYKSQARPLSGEDAAAPFRLEPFRDMTHRWASVDRPSLGDWGMVRKSGSGTDQELLQLLQEIRDEQRLQVRQSDIAQVDRRLGQLDRKLDSMEQELRKEVRIVRQEVKGEIQAVRQELKGEIRDFSARTHYGFKEVLAVLSAVSVHLDTHERAHTG